MPGNLSRRSFLERIGATTVAGKFIPQAWAVPVDHSAVRGEELRLGFSTLGCPAWSWNKILDFAKQYGFLGVELRGIEGNMDLPTCPEFSPGRIEQSMKDVAERGLHISSVDSSAAMHEIDPQKREQQMADARRFIDLASRLNVSYIRVFGNQVVGAPGQAITRVANSLRELGDYAGPKNVTVLIESHGDFTHSPTLREILERADSPHVALLWDANHTYIQGGEDPGYTVEQVGKYIRHTHLKDSVGKGDNTHYVLTGHGEVPVKRQVQLLINIGYTGYYSYEWEKVWHPELEDPEVAFPDYSRVMTGYLKDAYSHRRRLSVS